MEVLRILSKGSTYWLARVGELYLFPGLREENIDQAINVDQCQVHIYVDQRKCDHQGINIGMRKS